MYLAIIYVAESTDHIASGCFTSVVAHQDQVYAVDNHRNLTQVFQLNETSSKAEWHRLRSMQHDFFEEEFTLTLGITNNELICCSEEDPMPSVYSLSGECLDTYGGPGRFDASGLAYICDDDDDGSVLIANWDDRLQVMSEQGEFSVLQLQPPVSAPRSAVLFNKQLFVTSASCDKARIHEYLC